jgi:hypothetical protein
MHMPGMVGAGLEMHIADTAAIKIMTNVRTIDKHLGPVIIANVPKNPSNLR